MTPDMRGDGTKVIVLYRLLAAAEVLAMSLQDLYEVDNVSDPSIHRWVEGALQVVPAVFLERLQCAGLTNKVSFRFICKT